MPAALAALGRALALGEPEGYVRVFLDEGPPMAALLQDAANRGIAPDYVRRLLTASVRPEDNAGNKEALIEPLSDRELDVLRLLATDLAGPEIARELVVSLSTVRSHTKAIYAKLGVNNRRAAVTRAEELDLLSRAATDRSSRREAHGRAPPQVALARSDRRFITVKIPTCGDARSPRPLRCSGPRRQTRSQDRRKGADERNDTHRRVTVTRTAATRFASRDTWMADGLPGLTA